MSSPARVQRAILAPQGWRGDLLALVSGAPIPLAFAPFGYYGVPVLCLVGLLWSLEGQSPRSGLWRGFLFGVSSFLGGLYWVHVSIHVFGGAALPLALVLMFALVLFMATYTAVFGWSLNRFFGRATWQRLLLGAPALWVTIEWLRGWLFSGFGWLGIGYSQSDGPLHSLLPVVGVYGASLALCLAAAGVWASVTLPAARRVALLPFAAVVVVALVLSRAAWTTPVGEPFSVALVQGAVPQELKWLPESLQPTVDLYMNLTDDHLGADLVVWPEAAIPTARHNLDAVFEALLARGADSGTDFLIGAVQVDRARDQRLNTVVALRSDTGDESTYVKRHLVPYGEYFPVPDFVREWIRWMNLPYQDFTSGADDQPPLTVARQTVGVSICYEDVFGHELLEVLPAASVLVNVSNDAWFGGSIAPHQHLQIARARALEAGRMLLRATNNGISAVIDHDGVVRGRSPQFEPYVLSASVQGRAGATPYSRVGNWPVITLSLLLLALAARRAR